MERKCLPSRFHLVLYPQSTLIALILCISIHEIHPWNEGIRKLTVLRTQLDLAQSNKMLGYIYMYIYILKLSVWCSWAQTWRTLMLHLWYFSNSSLSSSPDERGNVLQKLPFPNPRPLAWRSSRNLLPPAFPTWLCPQGFGVCSLGNTGSYSPSPWNIRWELQLLLHWDCWAVFQGLPVVCILLDQPLGCPPAFGMSPSLCFLLLLPACVSCNPPAQMWSPPNTWKRCLSIPNFIPSGHL